MIDWFEMNTLDESVRELFLLVNALLSCETWKKMRQRNVHKFIRFSLLSSDLSSLDDNYCQDTLLKITNPTIKPTITPNKKKIIINSTHSPLEESVEDESSLGIELGEAEGTDDGELEGIGGVLGVMLGILLGL